MNSTLLRLTTEVMEMKSQIKQLKQQLGINIMENNSCASSFPLSSKESVLEFEGKCVSDENLSQELVSTYFI